MFNGNDPIRIMLEIIRAVMATGLNLKTILKFYGIVKTAKISRSTHLKSF